MTCARDLTFLTLRLKFNSSQFLHAEPSVFGVEDEELVDVQDVVEPVVLDRVFLRIGDVNRIALNAFGDFGHQLLLAFHKFQSVDCIQSSSLKYNF